MSSSSRSDRPGRSSRVTRGAYRGRPPRIDMEATKQRLATGLSPTQVARGLTRHRLQGQGCHDGRRVTRPGRFGFTPRNVVIHLEVGHRRSVRVTCLKMSMRARSGRLGPDAPSGVRFGRRWETQLAPKFKLGPDYAPSSSCSIDRLDCALGRVRRPPNRSERAARRHVIGPNPASAPVRSLEHEVRT